MGRKGHTTSLDLDVVTSRLLAHLAETWGVSEEEAVRRALEQANANADFVNKDVRWEAFKELQRRLNLTPAKAADWQDAVHDARR